MNASLHVKRSNILVVDPNLGSLGALCRQLQDVGHHTFEAADVVEALSCAASQPVDLVILRVRVDDTIGTDLPSALHEVCPTPGLSVIVLAEHLDLARRCEYLNSGADDVIDADTEYDEMLARVGALLRIKDPHRELEAAHMALQNALRRERRLMAKLEQDNAQLQRLATTDPLTHVQNVRSFHDILAHEYKASKRYGYSLSMLMIDVDHFKVINDTHGHHSGDYVLKELAVIFKRAVRESDVVARTGGEEFSVVLPRADRKQAGKFAERIRAEVFNRKFIVYESDIHVTVSIGSATYPDDAEVTDEQMLAYFADQALLEAKENGRDRVVAFDSLTFHVRQRLRSQHLRMGDPPVPVTDGQELGDVSVVNLGRGA